MALDFLGKDQQESLRETTLSGPALPEPFVRFELEKLLKKLSLLPELSGLAGDQIREQWSVLQRKLRDISPNSGPIAVANRLMEPLASRLGYDRLEDAPEVQTREGLEPGGRLMLGTDSSKLRCWSNDFDADLDAPTKRGHAYRYSPTRVAQRVLLASGERLGLLTNGTQLRLLICDPARPDSVVEFNLSAWARARELPDTYQLLLALASPAGVKALPLIVEDARLKQNKVTKELRVQARLAVETFIQSILDNDGNRERLAQFTDKSALAKQLWHEGLVVIYRLLFILKCESTSDPSRVFRFASTSLWRNTYSPNTALARIVRRVLDEGTQSGRFLEDGLRVLFRMFEQGVDHPGLTVRPLGGALFGVQSAPLLTELKWGELAVARLLDGLLWTSRKRGSTSRERVHYGPLDVEDLGRVYEALLELEPGISIQPMCRLRRQKLEVVVPAAQGEKYKPKTTSESALAGSLRDLDTESESLEEEPEETEAPARGKKTKVEWIEAIPPGCFYLRVGLGRKSSGSFYTPHSFVRFLVQETLGPQCAERSPKDKPDPGAILKLKVLDPACGSGHFLVEACRFLADRLYEAARLCDEQAAEAETQAETEADVEKKQTLLDRAAELRRQLQDLPDNDDELLSYLPGRAPEGGVTGYSQAKAEGICRRLVAVHCLYGVDVNPLAVELAKLSLWIESHAEGLPLTFLDHRVVLGNSLTGPFANRLIIAPGSQQPIQDLFRQNLDRQLTARLTDALSLVHDLEAGVGVDVDEVRKKQAIKAELDRKLMPFRILAAAWSGGVMLGTERVDGAPRCNDDAYAALLKHIGETGDLPEKIDDDQLLSMVAKGLSIPDGVPNIPRDRHGLVALAMSGAYAAALAYDLVFPEVFHPTGMPLGRYGFDAVIGNPPWDAIQFKSREFLGSFDIEILNTNSKKERAEREKVLLAELTVAGLFRRYQDDFEEQKRSVDALFEHQKVHVEGDLAGRQVDAFRVFVERSHKCLHEAGILGQVLPGALCGAAGAVGVRRLLFTSTQIRHCYTYQNKKKIFDIVTNVKFTILVSRRQAVHTGRFPVAFYALDEDWLFAGADRPGLLYYDAKFVQTTGGPFTTLIELKSQTEVDIASTCSVNGSLAGARLAELKMKLGAECHMTNDFERFESVEKMLGSEDPRDPEPLMRLWQIGALVLSDEDSIHQYDDHWTERPSYVVPVDRVGDRPDWLRPTCYYRLFVRRIATVVDRRSFMCAVIPPGWLSGSPHANKKAGTHPHCCDLTLLGILNSFAADWNLRLRLTATVSLFILESVPLPRLLNERLVAHCSLRLTGNHAGFEALWREQLGDEWRESDRAPFTWPVLASNEERWVVRAAIDAVVADAYGLSREQYAHVLSTFSHTSYPKAPQQCVAAFDELKSTGLEAFCKKHDPYWDIPLNENLPQPVIDLPIPEPTTDVEADASPKISKRRKKSANTTPALWQERDGQHTLESPGPIFDEAISRALNSITDANYTQLVALLRNRREISSSDARDILGLTAADVRPLLLRLVNEGVARKVGAGRATKYGIRN